MIKFGCETRGTSLPKLTLTDVMSFLRGEKLLKNCDFDQILKFGGSFTYIPSFADQGQIWPTHGMRSQCQFLFR